MSLISDKFNTNSPMPSILPKEWNGILESDDNVLFDNLDQFVYIVSKLKQDEDNKCGISYEKALDMLIRKQSDFPKIKQESARNLVRNNLFKRGLITAEIYENFKYTGDGTNLGFDVGKYAAGDADCILTPSREYIDFFYELYINIAYPWDIDNEVVKENVAKLLATVEELERKHIFIKINVVVSIKELAKVDGEEKNFFSILPVFSHKDRKDVDVMSSVINEKLFRKFYFAVIESLYGDDGYGHKGYPVDLPKTMNIGYSFDEVELFESIMKEVGA